MRRLRRPAAGPIAVHGVLIAHTLLALFPIGLFQINSLEAPGPFSGPVGLADAGNVVADRPCKGVSDSQVPLHVLRTRRSTPEPQSVYGHKRLDRRPHFGPYCAELE